MFWVLLIEFSKIRFIWYGNAIYSFRKYTNALNDKQILKQITVWKKFPRNAK